MSYIIPGDDERGSCLTDDKKGGKAKNFVAQLQRELHRLHEVKLADDYIKESEKKDNLENIWPLDADNGFLSYKKMQY